MRFYHFQSANVQNAYYECEWYKMPLKYQKQMSICIACVQKPLKLTAGRFYVFSLGRFSGVSVLLDINQHASVNCINCLGTENRNGLYIDATYHQLTIHKT